MSDKGAGETAEELNCPPLERFCLDPSTSAFCDASGQSHGLPQACAAGEVCSVLTGLCGATSCVPGTWGCADTHRRQLCHESGSDWVPEKEPCPDTGFCYEGACTPCIPGVTRCHDSASMETCSDDGFGYQPAVACAYGEGCPQEVGTCTATLCVPGQTQCTSETTFTQCASDGASWSVIASCGEGTLCLDGGCQACAQGTSYCLDDETQMTCDANIQQGYVAHTCGPYQTCHEDVGHCEWGPWPCVAGAPDCVDALTMDQCADDGSSWEGIPETCPQDEVCNFGACVSTECQPNIMFLVDRSGSMQGEKWYAVLNSIGEVIHGNRSFRYGIRFFPPTDGPVDKQAPGPHLPLGVLNSYAVLLNLFSDWYPEGNTPLTTMFDRIIENADNFFEGSPGALVLLTDGEPGCWPSAAICDANLVSAAESLWYENGVRTYPIGFAFGGDTSFLDTIAQHGGADLEQHITAENAADLTAALEAIVDELDDCPNETP